jgi:large subunit ribosomal protein L32e
MPNPGYRGNKETRGLHPSGYEEVIVNRPEELEALEEGQAARISGKVGDKKREMIVEEAEELEVKVLNPGDHE